jgi:hypothetical protein
MAPTLRAVVLVPVGHPDEERQQWRTQCLEHCELRGYGIVGFATRWEDAAYMQLEREADVIVAAREEHFAPDRVPRTEVAGTPPQQNSPAARERRARWSRPLSDR